MAPRFILVLKPLHHNKVAVQGGFMQCHALDNVLLGTLGSCHPCGCSQRGIPESPVESVDSFRYLSVHIILDLSWSCHINTVVKKAWQSLYHLRGLRDFRLPSKVLRNFYSCTVESILKGNITTWFGNNTMQDRRALQRVA
ncbi:hypothetical protein QTP70_011649 [Hemibagrus guttatus]|uniref:Alkylated DNA repair protein AlkB homologue 8 N-terminal domain-containing protein n=1 Tax=Hemibagrus guttatus TaxID=175788 RepID=A0AAE0R3P9_9TELE|nr:hypothetical protein QTP70_011649 [Hemibagrus guttatus]